MLLSGDISARQGSDVTVYDSYEDQDISEYDGNTGNFVVSQSFAADGSYGVEHDSTGYETITSDSGLDAYPSAETTLFAHVYGDKAGLSDFCQAEFIWGHEGSAGSLESCYGCRIEFDDNQVLFREYDSSGSGSNLDVQGPTISTPQEYYYEIFWPSDPTSTAMTVDIVNASDDSVVTSLSSTASTAHTSGGIGWEMYRGDASMITAGDYIYD